MESQIKMNWDDLKFFLALARTGTVSAAGRELSVKHTTVARRITALEQRLGTRLFDHLRDGYAMTHAGEGLYEHALKMEEQVQAIDRRVFGLDHQLCGTLKLTGAYDVMSRLVIPQLGEFTRDYPGIDLHLMGSAGLLDLSARQADIALRLTDKPPEYLVGKKVLPLVQGIYGSTDYLNKQKDVHDVVIFHDQEGKPEWVREHFNDANIVMKVDEMTSLLACVNNHLGLARLPCFVADLEPNLRRLDMPLTPSTWGLWLLSHVDLRATAKVRVCKEFIEDILEQQRDLVEGKTSHYFDVK